VTFSSSGSGAQNLAFNNNITGSGAQNLTLSGTGNGSYAFSMQGVTANDVNVTAAAGSTNNTLTLNTGATQNFNLTGVNTGNIGIATVNNFNFGNINNLIGGSNGQNIFSFMTGSALSGKIIGGNTTFNNIVSFSSYAGKLALTLSSGSVISAGIVKLSSTMLANFSEIQQSNGNAPSYASYLILPQPVSGGRLTVNYYGVSALNSVSDPFYFTGWLLGSPAPPVPTTLPPIASIVNQPLINAANNIQNVIANNTNILSVFNNEACMVTTVDKNPVLADLIDINTVNICQTDNRQQH
jgi:hypothetical protein